MPAAVSENTPRAFFGNEPGEPQMQREARGRSAGSWRFGRSVGRVRFGGPEEGSGRAGRGRPPQGRRAGRTRRSGSGTARRKGMLSSESRTCRLTGPPSAKFRTTEVARPGWPQKPGRARPPSRHATIASAGNAKLPADADGSDATSITMQQQPAALARRVFGRCITATRRRMRRTSPVADRAPPRRRRR